MSSERPIECGVDLIEDCSARDDWYRKLEYGEYDRWNSYFLYSLSGAMSHVVTEMRRGQPGPLLPVYGLARRQQSTPTT